MKQTLKKALSLLMTVAILCSFAVVSANAEGAVTIGLENGSWDGDKYTVDVVASGDDFAVASVEIDVKFDPAVLTWVSNNGGYSGGVLASLQNGDTVHAAGMSANDVPSADGKLVLVGLTFQVAADAETQDTAMEVVVDDALFEDVSGNAPALSAARPLSVHVTGQPPMLDVLDPETASVTVEGIGQDETVTFNAKSTKGANINGAMDWTITPASDDVSISGGVVTVKGNAQPGSYTVTATPKAGEARGDAKTATLTVTRADVRQALIIDGPATLTIPKEGSAPAGTYTAMVSNQFGDDPRPATGVVWSVSGSDQVTIDAATGVVTVAAGAVKGATVTVTAAMGEVTGTKTATLVDMEVTATPKANPTYGDTWAEIIPMSGVKALMGDTAVTVNSVSRTIDGKAVDSLKPDAGSYQVTVTARTAEGDASVTVSVTVAKLAVTVKLDDQKVEYTGEVIKAKDQKYKVEKTGETLTLKAEGEGTEISKDGASYKVTYTCDNPNYTVTVEGGNLVIVPKKVKPEDNGALEDLTLDGATVKFESTTDGDGTKTTLTVRLPSGSYRNEEKMAAALEETTKNVVITVKVGGVTFEYKISGWALQAGTSFNSKGKNVFVPTGFESRDEGAEKYMPDLGDFTFVVNATASGGSNGGGTSSGNQWSSGGNQIINLTPVSIFTDVPDGHPFLSDIMWLYGKGVMKGTSANTFSPASGTNRQQLWMVLARLNGSNPQDMATARAWAMNNSVSDGSSATSPLTRQQMVTMLYRWAQSKGYTGVISGSLASYKDAGSVSDYARDAMTWAVGNGIINGDTAGNLNPNGTATRGQFAAIIHRFCLKFAI